MTLILTQHYEILQFIARTRQNLHRLHKIRTQTRTETMKSTFDKVSAHTDHFKKTLKLTFYHHFEKRKTRNCKEVINAIASTRLTIKRAS